MTDEYEPRIESEPTTPHSVREQRIYRAIRNILAKYTVRGDAKDLDKVTLEIWRVTKQ